MAIQNDNTLVTKGDLKELYTDKIAPYLGGGISYYHTDRTGQELKSAHAVLTSDWTATLNGTVPFIKQSGSFISPSDGIFTIPDGTTIELIASISSNPHGDSVYVLYNNTDNVVINDFQWTDPYAVSPYYKSTVYITQWKNDTGHDVNISMRCTNPNNSSKLIKKETTLSIKEIGRIVDPIQYTSNNDELEETPVGNIISYMGNSVPKHHLACDGTEYAIGTYPKLEAHIIKEFGSINYFGGDGTTTWAVPDLNGEFLRGTGTNGHTASGDGADVGIHQSATGINPGWVNNQAGGFSLPVAPSSDYSALVVDAGDKYVNTGKRKSIASSTDLKEVANTTDDGGYWTVRPTNTSVKFCIKYESTYHVIVPSHMYKVSVPFSVKPASNAQIAILDTTNIKGDSSLISGGNFVAPIAGWYICSGKSRQYNWTSGGDGRIVCYWRINGDTFNGGTYADCSTYTLNNIQSINLCSTIYLNKGDTINLYVYGDNGWVNTTFEGDLDFCLLTANYKDNIIAGGEVYSTEEQVIGTWTDGKPLYQKIIDNISFSSSQILIPFSNEYTVRKISGFVYNTNGRVPIGYGIDTNDAVSVYQDSNGLQFQNGFYSTYPSGEIIVQYTKTTDTAGTYQYKNSLLLTRPDMWEPNTEYDFGGGLYGYRKTGTISNIAAGGRADVIIVSGITNATIVNSGGTIGSSNYGYSIPSTHVQGNREQFIWYNKSLSGYLTNSIILYIGNFTASAITNETYDVWVTYTK